MFKIYYRISDKGNPFGRLNGYENAWFQILTRRDCLSNFIKIFGKNELIIVADNVNDDTFKYLQTLNIDNLIRTNLGNIRSFKLILEMAIKELTDEDIVYFVEDDYIHTGNCKELINEGLEQYHYVSLFDHLDKYIDNGNNPLIKNHGEDTKVIITKTSHWKYTNATTMTFAAKIKILKQDYDVIMKYNQDHFPHPYNLIGQDFGRNFSGLTGFPLTRTSK